jgi:hypothetical protein
MPRNVAKLRVSPKSSDSHDGNQIPQKGNQISPVMQKVRSLLPAHKAAWHLAILIDEPLGQCQKLLCGERHENGAILSKLLRSEFGRDVLLVVMGDASPDWFSRYRKQLDINDARRKLVETQRALEALQVEASQ